MDKLDGRAMIESYVREHGVSDKDARVSGAHRNTGKKDVLEKRRKGLLRKVIDLHGKTVEEARPLLCRALDECKRKGIGELLVIHGWGRHSNPAEGGILKKMALDFLEYRFKNDIRWYKTALPRDGGEGATVVRLK